MMKKNPNRPATGMTLAAQMPEIQNPAGKGGIKRLFTGRQGVRLLWLLLAAVLLYRGIGFAVRLVLSGAFAGLFAAWRVNPGNIHLAPKWAQAVYSWHGSLITVIVCLISVPVSLLLRRMWPGRGRKINTAFRPAVGPALFGAGIAVVSAVLFLLADSMRPEWPLSEPRLSWTLIIMLPVTLLAAFSEELFTKSVIYDGATGRMGRIWACILSAIVFFLSNGGYSGTVVSGLNVFLMGLCCCVLYERGGLWAATLFRGMWSYVSVFIAGFGAMGAAGSVYALYGVSETAITGGDGGLIYGLWMTVILLGMTAWMERENLVEMKNRLARGKRDKAGRRTDLKEHKNET